MEKRKNIKKSVSGSAILASGAGITGSGNAIAANIQPADVVVERAQRGKPSQGKVFAAVHAHLNDVPYYCAGTVAKLINEGYTGYLIRTTNDEKQGGQTNAMNVLNHEQENLRMAKALGFTDVFNLYTRENRMHEISPIEIRGRLIFIFRFLKVDTVLSYNPRGGGEEDFDKLFTARAVEEACLAAGMENDFPEFQEGGVLPYPVKERYYYVTKSCQPFNRVVDIGTSVEQKTNAILGCKSRGGGNKGSLLRKQLAKEGKRLPLLGNDDNTADREYVRHFLLKRYGSFEGIEQYGMEYAERFYYSDDRKTEEELEVEEYIKKNAVKI